MIVGPLESDDTIRARECLTALGARYADRDGSWSVSGVNGEFSAPSGSLDAGESGLTSRFLLALTPFIPSPVVIQGRGRLPERPMEGLLDNLEQRGAQVERGYPWRIDASGAARSGTFAVDASSSSQMVSALLLAAPLAGGTTTLAVESLQSSAEYVALTVDVMDKFGGRVVSIPDGYRVEGGGYLATSFAVPIDASSAVYPACAAALTGGTAEIMGDMGNHPDRKILEVLSRMGCSVEPTGAGTLVRGPHRLEPVEMDMSAAPDAAVCLAVVCSRAAGASRIGGLESLRLKESDRLSALRTELTRFGATVVTDADSIEIEPGPEQPVTFSTYNDHRIAMSLALLGLVVSGISVDDPDVVNKTWPGYWEWLATTGAILTKSE